MRDVKRRRRTTLLKALSVRPVNFFILVFARRVVEIALVDLWNE